MAIPGINTAIGVIARIIDTLWPSKKEALYDKLKSLEAKYADALRKGDDEKASLYKKEMENLRKRADFTNVE